MVLGLMQPYFFPHLGYFDLIHRVDQWIAFDTAQYTRRGWIHRNRILHPVKGWQYIVVPVQKHPRDTAISDIRIVEDARWSSLIERQLHHYHRRAPYFDAVMALVRDCLGYGGSSLAELNITSLRKVCAFLHLPFEGRRLSEMGQGLEPIDGPGDWALRLAEVLRADEYVNPPGGSHLYDPAKFTASGIRLTIQEPVSITYACPGYSFEPLLSILDVLMWNHPDQVQGFLQGFLQRRGTPPP